MVQCGIIQSDVPASWSAVTTLSRLQCGVAEVHFQTIRNFLYMLPTAVAQSSNDTTVEYGFVYDVMFSHGHVGAVLKQVVKIARVFARGRHAV